MALPILAKENYFWAPDAVIKCSQIPATGAVAGTTFGCTVNNFLNNMEISYPLAWLKHSLGWPKKKWSSPFRVFVIGDKNKIRFRKGGVWYTATITIGIYRGAELASEIETQMNIVAGSTDITCTYAALAHVFTWANIEWLSPAFNTDTGNRINSAFPALGIDCSYEHDSTQLTGDYAVSSTWGTFIFITAQQNLRFTIGATPYNAIIPAGVYTLAGLLATIVDKMTAQFAGAWDAARAESTLKITIKSGNGTSFRLDFGTSDTPWDELGWTNTNTVFATSHTAPEVRIHTYEELIIDTITAKRTDIEALIANNFTTDAVVDYQQNSSESWSAPPHNHTIPDAGIPWDQRMMVKLHTSAGTAYRYTRFKIQDKKNPAGKVMVGKIWGSRGDSNDTIDSNFRIGSDTGYEIESEIIESDSRDPAGSETDPRWIGGLLLKNLLDADADKLFSIFQTNKQLKPFLALLIPSGNDLHKWTKYVRWNSKQCLLKIVDPAGYEYKAPFVELV